MDTRSQTDRMPIPLARAVAPKLGVLLSSLLACYPLATRAGAELPGGGTVASGQAAISQSATTMTIEQVSPRAIIDWQTFNVGSAATVNFVQPDAGAATLNRVLDSAPSQIFGQINATGQVFLINPSGIYFGPTSSLDVGGLVATTHDIANADFMAGNLVFSRNGSSGQVVNEGRLKASDLGGYIALLAPEVRNQGIVLAHLGSVALAAGETYTLTINTQGQLVDIAVTPAQIAALVENRSLVQAPGGQVIMSAQAVNSLLGNIVNSGQVEATGLAMRNGRIVLESSGQTEVAGQLDAGSPQGQGGEIRLTAGGDLNLQDATLDTSGLTQGGSITLLGAPASAESGGSTVMLGGKTRLISNSAAGQGGTLTVTGHHVGLVDQATLEAIGETGGGNIQLGGSWQNSDAAVPQATAIYIGKDSVLDASAGGQGEGGSVVAWSNVVDPISSTRVYGTLRARGGLFGGNGGRVETSGHWLDVQGSAIDATAPAGTGGVWLLDPDDLTVTAAAAVTDITPVAGAFGEQIFTSDSATSKTTVLNTDIEGQLNAGTSVTLQTGAGVAQPGDLSVNANITKTAGGPATLILSAHNNISLAAGVNISSSLGALNVELYSDLDASGAGDISLGAGSSIVSKDGYIALVGGPASSFSIGGDLNAGSNSITLAPGLAASGSGNLVASGLVLNGPSFTLNTAPANNVGILAGSVGDVTFENSAALEIGSVNDFIGTPYAGISAISPISIATTSGNLTVSQPVVTTDATPSAIVLNAGSGSTAGTASGGDLSFPGLGNATPGAGGTVKLYSGNITNADLWALGGTGSGNFRYNSDELVSNFSAALGTGIQVIYRQQPTATFSASSPAPITYGDATPGVSGGVSGLVNGDGAGISVGAVISGAPNAFGRLNAGSYVVSPSPSANNLTALGYNLAYGSGNLMVQAKPITLSGAKEYDGTPDLLGSQVTLDTGISGETLHVRSATASSAHVSAGNYISAITLLDGTGLASNYTLPVPSSSPVTITPRPLTVNATIGGILSKPYDGTTAATGATLTGSFSGGLSGDSFSVDTTGLTLQYNDAHVSAAREISTTGSAGINIDASTWGSLPGDYVITMTPVAPINASITPRVFSPAATIGGSLSKPYDGTVAAPDVSVSGVYTDSLTGDTFSISQGSVVLQYNDAHVVNARQILVASGTPAFSITSSPIGSLPGDYDMTSVTIEPINATISPLSLSVTNATIGGLLSKLYDGTKSAPGATLTGNVSGGIAGDQFSLGNGNLMLQYNDPHVTAARQIHASAGTPAFAISTSSKGSLQSDYAMAPIAGATGSATITAAMLTASLTTNSSGVGKTYDGNNSVPVDFLPHWSVNGLLPGDSAAIDFGGASYDNQNVVSGNRITVTGVSLQDINGNGQFGDYTLETTSASLLAFITPRTVGLSASKQYDGSPILIGTNVTITTGIKGESLGYSGATAFVADTGTPDNYISAITLENGVGGLASNYQLPELNAANAPVNITPTTDAGSITASVTGTTAPASGGTTSAAPMSNSGGQNALLSGEGAEPSGNNQRSGSIQTGGSDRGATNASITPDGMRAMTVEQLKQLSPAQISNLSPQALQAMSTTQLAQLSQLQVNSLSTAQVQQFSFEQIKSMVPAKFAHINEGQIQKLTPEGRRELVILGTIARDLGDSTRLDYGQAISIAPHLARFIQQLELAGERNQTTRALPWSEELAAMRFGRWALFPEMQYEMKPVGLLDDLQDPLESMASEIGTYFAEKKVEGLFSEAQLHLVKKYVAKSKATRTLLDATPVIGNLLSLYTATTGKDALTGETVDSAERALAILGTVPGGGVLLKMAGKSSAQVVRALLVATESRRIDKSREFTETAFELISIYQSDQNKQEQAPNPELEGLAEQLLKKFLPTPERAHPKVQ